MNFSRLWARICRRLADIGPRFLLLGFDKEENNIAAAIVSCDIREWSAIINGARTWKKYGNVQRLSLVHPSNVKAGDDKNLFVPAR